MAYDRGNPSTVTRIGPGLYRVGSWRNQGTDYTVDLVSQDCSCDDCRRRQRTCKHIAQARSEAWAESVRKARQLPDHELEQMLQRYQEADRVDVAGAIRFVRAERQAAARKDAELRAVFA